MNPVFYMLSFALFFWSISSGLSNYLGKPAPRKKVETKQIADLSEVVKTNPNDEKANMDLAFSLVKSGFQNGDMKLIMQAVQVFRNVLDINPNNEQALIGLASLCLQSGVLDKADTYYQRYLDVKPNDLNAKADFAMVKFKLKQVDEGEKLLQEIIKKDEKLFSAYAVGAIAYNAISKTSGMKEKFDFYFNKAKQTAPSIDAIRNLENAFKGEAHYKEHDNIAKNKPSEKTEPKEVLAEKPLIIQAVSKKDLENYFIRHQIIGPKLVSHSWKENTLNLELKEFPVDKMPAFAKTKFISGINEVVGDKGYIVRILDSISKKELMLIDK